MATLVEQHMQTQMVIQNARKTQQKYKSAHCYMITY